MRAWLLSAGLGLVIGAALLTLIATALTRMAPVWWRTVLREDPATVTLARATENRLTTLVYEKKPPPDGRPPDTWTIEIDDQAANAWLNVRLPKWLASQRDQFHWPRDMTDLQVAFHHNQITIGARVRAGDRLQVLTATVAPRVDELGRLWIPASAVSLGRLDIPGPWVVRAVRARAMDYIPPALRNLPETAQLVRAFEGDQSILNTAAIRLGDGRRVRVIAIEAHQGVLRLTCTTERDAGPHADAPALRSLTPP